MNIIYADEFRKGFRRLPSAIQRLYQKQEMIFKKDWKDARLHSKKLIDHPFPFSFRITRNYRVLFSFVDQDTTLFGTIGHRRDAYR